MKFLTTGLGKPSQDANLLMKFISEDSLFGEHISDAQVVKLLIDAV